MLTLSSFRRWLKWQQDFSSSKKGRSHMDGGLPITRSGSQKIYVFCCLFNHLQGKDNSGNSFWMTLYIDDLTAVS